MKHSGAATLAMGIALFARIANAEPSVWARAADPKRAAETDALAEARRLEAMAETGEGRGRAVITTIYLRNARALLEVAAADRSADARLRFTLANVERELFRRDGDPKHLQRALPLLRFAAGHARSTELASAALFDLALCDAQLGRRQDEIDAYDRALWIEPGWRVRSIVLANRAEALMSLGDAGGAEQGYRDAIAVLPTVAVGFLGVTTLWGLAVALDRSGDLPAALEQIRLARAYDPDDRDLHGPDWFFAPAYDEAWYAALGHWQRARQAGAPDRIRALDQAIASWRAYLGSAPPGDPWLALAEMRLRQCERERAR